jgi:hypothetical protein
MAGISLGSGQATNSSGVFLAGLRGVLVGPVWPMPEEAAMAKSWRCRLRLHRWQRIRGPDGQWYRECRDCGTQLIDRYREGPPPTAIS